MSYLKKLKEENRIGKIEITTALLEILEEDIVKKIFNGFIVLRAESLYHKGVIEYIGYSINFDSIRDYEAVPQYNCKITEKRDTTGIILEWEKIG